MNSTDCNLMLRCITSTVVFAMDLNDHLGERRARFIPSFPRPLAGGLGKSRVEAQNKNVLEAGIMLRIDREVSVTYLLRGIRPWTALHKRYP